MTGQEKIKRAYTIYVRQLADDTASYRILYAPRRLQQVRENGPVPRVDAEFEIVARINGETVTLQRVNPPMDPEATQEEFDRDAATRAQLLHDWLTRLTFLVRSVEGWVKELGWETRVVEKPMEDSQIGKYNARALLIQEGIDRLLLEPVARSAPGTDGVVDLYRMPAYDDIANLYFYDGRWNLHFAPAETGAAATVREAQAKPLSKDTLEEVLAEMRQHAA